MIQRAHRFHGRGSLRMVYQRGQVLRGPFTALRYLPNPRRNAYRVAIVVSRKVSKSAVIRNRIRRRLYEIIRSEEMHIARPYDLVLTVFNDQVATADFTELEGAVLIQLRKAGVLASHKPDSTSDHGIVEQKER
jgi:ribonuclease P protein component